MVAMKDKRHSSHLTNFSTVLHLFLNLAQHLDGVAAKHLLAASVKPVVKVLERHTHAITAANMRQFNGVVVEAAIDIAVFQAGDSQPHEFEDFFVPNAGLDGEMLLR